MVKKDALHVVFVGHFGMIPGARSHDERCAKVFVERADVTQLNDLHATLAKENRQAHTTVARCVHSAVTLDDGVLLRQTRAYFAL